MDWQVNFGELHCFDNMLEHASVLKDHSDDGFLVEFVDKLTNLILTQLFDSLYNLFG